MRVEAAHLTWGTTTYLNLAFLAVALVVWWLAHQRTRFGGGVGYATDPVCAMQVRLADAPGHAHFDGVTYHFCSDRCRERFEADPVRYTDASPSAHASPDEDESAVDPVCGMSVDTTTATDRRDVDGTTVWFCGPGCARRFDDDRVRDRDGARRPD